jgi:WXG100 family type VII secretion target
MAGYQTGTPELQKAAQNMENTNQQLQSNIKQLESILATTQPAWQGQAATAFAHLMQRFQEDATKLNQSLMQIAEQVTGAASSYAQQEENASQQMSRITQALGGA